MKDRFEIPPNPATENAARTKFHTWMHAQNKSELRDKFGVSGIVRIFRGVATELAENNAYARAKYETFARGGPNKLYNLFFEYFDHIKDGHEVDTDQWARPVLEFLLEVGCTEDEIRRSLKRDFVFDPIDQRSMNSAATSLDMKPIFTLERSSS